ncbi:MAG: hypothetical protein U0P48_11425 [Ancrocorticia sp.]
MPGGTPNPTIASAPCLEKISAQIDGVPCCTHVLDGAGHFVKMVHNGIEYADMQLIAEAYDPTRKGLGMSATEIGQVFEEWNKGELGSYLIEITADVLQHMDPKTGQPFVDIVLDRASQKGTGTWTVQNGAKFGISTGIAELPSGPARSPAPCRSVSLRRKLSPRTPPRCRLRIATPSSSHPSGALRLQDGCLLPGLRSHPRRQTSTTGTWIWEPRSHSARRPHYPRRALNRIEAYERNPELSPASRGEYFSVEIAKAVSDCRVLRGTERHPDPVSASSLSYYDGVRSGEVARQPHPGPA